MAKSTPQSAQETGREVARRAPSHRWGGSPLAHFHEEFDRLFDSVFSGFPRFMPWRGEGENGGFVTPEIDVTETEKEYRVEAELPGLDQKEVSLSLSDGVLTLKGDKKEERKEGEEGKGYYLSERRFGAFQRSLRLPSDIDEEKVTAEFKNGVLKVHLPKSEEAHKSARKIEIKGS